MRCLFLVVCLLTLPAHAQLRIVTYNTAGEPRPGVELVLQAIGEQSVSGIAKPLDVLLLQEQDSMAGDTQDFIDLLNGIYGAGTYARGTINAGTSGAGRPGIIYNTQAVMLLDETPVGMVSASGPARQTMRYQLRPVGYDDAADFYAYSSHYKASSGSSNEARRLVEAQAIRSDADALGAGVQVIYAGDFNMQSSSEDAYQHLLGAGHGQAFDPINRPGNWTNDASFRDTHTQSPVTAARFGGQITGGMDDRFDQQLVTGELLDGEGLDYLPGSYRAFGNNGTHALNGEITSGTGASAAVLQALAGASDHLPVVVDYQVPAVMSASVTPAIPQGIIPVGYGLTWTLRVWNSADVVQSNGADELDYAYTVAGDVEGSGSGTAAALHGAAEHSFTLDSSTPGLKTIDVTVMTDSMAAMNPSFHQQLVVMMALQGDTDLDGDVDDFDLINMIVGYTGSGVTSSDWATGDHDLDGDTDDFDLIGAIAGYTGSLTASSVPEPATMLFAFVGGLALLRHRGHIVCRKAERGVAKR